MESSLARVLDYKLVFDSLADSSNCMVRLATLTARWPSTDIEPTGPAAKLPRGCIEQWKACADEEGFLDWNNFSSVLEKCIKEDSFRLNKLTETEKQSQSKAEQKLQSLRESKAASNRSGVARSFLEAPVQAAEIESFLTNCRGECLAQALVKARKEVYRCQMSQQRRSASSTAGGDGTPTRNTPRTPNDKSSITSKSTDSTKENAPQGMFFGNEKEELQKGVEVLERTRQWFSSRLEQLVLENRNSDPKKVRAEELLAVLEKGSAHNNETVTHIQHINQHLSSLAMTAASTSMDRSGSRMGTGHERLLSDPGPTTPNKYRNDTFLRTHRSTHTSPPTSGTLLSPSNGEAHVVGLEFPEYSPSSSAHQYGTSSRSRGRTPPMRSASMKEMRNSGIAAAAVTNQMRDELSYDKIHYRKHQQQGSSSGHAKVKPKRSHSFSYKGSSGTDSGISSSSSTASSSVTGKTDYPVNASSRRLPTSGGYMQQYPLRETASLNLIPGSSANSYGSGSGSGRGHSAHLPASSGANEKEGVSLRSSSALNLPSSYNRAGQSVSVDNSSAGIHAGRGHTGSHQQLYFSNASNTSVAMQPVSGYSAVAQRQAKLAGQQLQSSSTSSKHTRRGADLSGSHPQPTSSSTSRDAGVGVPSSPSAPIPAAGSHRGHSEKQHKHHHTAKASQEQALRQRQREAHNAVLMKEAYEQKAAAGIHGHHQQVDSRNTPASGGTSTAANNNESMQSVV